MDLLANQGIYLTDEQKAEYLEGLAEMRRIGDLDDGIAGYLDRINVLPGICTLESCMGHEGGDLPGVGFLYVKCSPEQDLVFERRVIPAFRAHAGNGLLNVRKEFDDRGAEWSFWFKKDDAYTVLEALTFWAERWLR